MDDEVYRIFLFSSRHSKSSISCEKQLESHVTPIQVVRLDNTQARERVLHNKAFQITHVPTILVIYTDDTAIKVEGLHKITEWIDLNFPESNQSTHTKVDEKNEGESTGIIDPQVSLRNPGSEQPESKGDEEFMYVEHLNQQLLGDDVQFVNAREEIGMTDIHMPATPIIRTGNVMTDAEKMKSESGLDIQC
jgi:type II secretory pathway component GspD/PulD (secretin)